MQQEGMIFRRKSKAKGDEFDAGPMFVGRNIHRQKTYGAGDEIFVTSKEDLPGFPNSIDGWTFVRNVGKDEEVPVPVTERGTDAKLRAVHVGRDKWKVVIAEPGFNMLEPNGTPMSVGQKVHPGLIVGKDRAEAYAATGVDPGVFGD